jgi:hypothetical protein
MGKKAAKPRADTRGWPDHNDPKEVPMATANDTPAITPERFASFHSTADTLEVSSAAPLTESPVVVIDTHAPAPAIAILLSARARRLFRTINVLTTAGLADVDPNDLVDMLHPMAEELQQLAEALEKQLLAVARDATDDAAPRPV